MVCAPLSELKFDTQSVLQGRNGSAVSAPIPPSRFQVEAIVRINIHSIHEAVEILCSPQFARAGWMTRRPLAHLPFTASQCVPEGIKHRASKAGLTISCRSRRLGLLYCRSWVEHERHHADSWAKPYFFFFPPARRSILDFSLSAAFSSARST